MKKISSAKIKTHFLFDLGGVLFTNGTNKFVEEIVRKYNLQEEKVREVIDGKIGSDYREAKISRDQFWSKIIKTLKLADTADALEKRWIDGYEIISGTKSIIKKLFVDGIFSHEVGVRKPDPKIYQYALKKSRSRPEETVFVDDKPHFLKQAKVMGIKTIPFVSPEELRKILIGEKLI